MSSPEDTKGPIVVWEDYGLEGWSPRSFDTLRDAVTAGAVTRQSTVTMLVDISKHIVEPVLPDSPPTPSQPQKL